ncbi:hypothetical protein GIB67_012954 [Kingdonia uniflora]|uniref:Uncharacterized protein n=1 Tax=Kingdonia uniflora TaxID=39325 RepID=A0A7J7NFX1_9MAGN|nr:hypothetical protein GIB67_012954 [Kingdonia uniflora]
MSQFLGKNSQVVRNTWRSRRPIHVEAILRLNLASCSNDPWVRSNDYYIPSLF